MLAIDPTTNEPIEAPEPATPKRFTRWDALEAGFAQISVSSPEQLRALIDRCLLFQRLGKARRDPQLVDFATILAIRAQRRLARLKRAI
jgi:hypothetical protein